MKEKILMYVGMLLFLGSSCASGGKVAQVDKPTSPNLVSTETDDEEHRLIILDPGFQNWFASFGKPVNYHNQQYYEQWNQRYVNQWNALVTQAGASRNPNYPFQNRIDYDPSQNYGIALNHELYWYFRYVEAQLGGRYNFGWGRRNL